MKFLVSFTFLTAVVGFSPMPSSTSRLSTRPMSLLDDWKNFFSPEERQHRKQDHERDMEEMRLAQKEILERRRDPSKMEVYHNEEVARHERLDHQHDVDIEVEHAQEWMPSKKPLTPSSPPIHSFLDEWKRYFSKEEMQHRRVQHHLDLMDTQDAEEEMLERRRDPAKMKAYHNEEERRHERLDKRHEVEVGLEHVEEYVDPKMKEGQDFIGDLFKNVFGKKKQNN